MSENADAKAAKPRLIPREMHNEAIKVALKSLELSLEFPEIHELQIIGRCALERIAELEELESLRKRR